MTLFALALVLAAALIHASWNLLAKQSGGDVHFALLTTLGVVVLWSPLGIWFSLHEAAGYGPLQWGLLMTSGALHVIYYLTLLRGYRLGDLSVVYPLARGTGPLLTALAATFLLDERLGVWGWIGVLGIVVGIVLIAGGPELLRALRGDGTGELGRLRAGVSYGLITGAFIAAYSVVDGYAVKRGGISPVLVDWLGSLVRLGLILPLVGIVHSGNATTAVAEIRATVRRSGRSALIIAAISPVAYVMVLFAAKLAPLSHVAPMREVSMLFAALLGGRLLEERNPGWRLAGAACIAIGVIVLALG